MRPKPELLVCTKQSEEALFYTLQCLGSVEGMVAATLQCFEECGGYGGSYVAVF